MSTPGNLIEKEKLDTRKSSALARVKTIVENSTKQDATQTGTVIKGKTPIQVYPTEVKELQTDNARR